MYVCMDGFVGIAACPLPDGGICTYCAWVFICGGVVPAGNKSLWSLQPSPLVPLCMYVGPTTCMYVCMYVCMYGCMDEQAVAAQEAQGGC